MKKMFYLIMCLIFLLLTFFFGSTALLGIRSYAYIGSIILLAIFSIVFLLLTVLFYKLYKKSK